VHEELLFWQPLDGRMIGEDNSVKLNKFSIANEPLMEL
jgi:hypothetical protein